MKRTALLAPMLILIVSSVPAVHGLPGWKSGSFAFALVGYEVEGRLVNATVYPDGNVLSVMSVDDVLQTPFGPASIIGRGEWSGAVNGTGMSGLIEDVSGAIRVCAPACGDTNFVGYGVWVGAFSPQGLEAEGTFQGSIIFTSSPFAQIPLDRLIPVNGTWTLSGFQA
jgi:hypothetical protein